MVAYYAERAQEYERIYEKPERQEQLHQLKRLLRDTLAGRRVVEAACGTGFWTAVAAETAAHITAVRAPGPGRLWPERASGPR